MSDLPALAQIMSCAVGLMGALVAGLSVYFTYKSRHNQFRQVVYGRQMDAYFDISESMSNLYTAAQNILAACNPWPPLPLGLARGARALYLDGQPLADRSAVARQDGGGQLPRDAAGDLRSCRRAAGPPARRRRLSAGRGRGPGRGLQAGHQLHPPPLGGRLSHHRHAQRDGHRQRLGSAQRGPLRRLPSGPGRTGSPLTSAPRKVSGTFSETGRQTATAPLGEHAEKRVRLQTLPVRE
jgi:hypothetical protein